MATREEEEMKVYKYRCPRCGKMELVRVRHRLYACRSCRYSGDGKPIGK
jgi:ribosomal protein L37AE/L43A